MCFCCRFLLLAWMGASWTNDTVACLYTGESTHSDHWSQGCVFGGCRLLSKQRKCFQVRRQEGILKFLGGFGCVVQFGRPWTLLHYKVQYLSLLAGLLQTIGLSLSTLALAVKPKNGSEYSDGNWWDTTTIVRSRWVDHLLELNSCIESMWFNVRHFLF